MSDLFQISDLNQLTSDSESWRGSVQRLIDQGYERPRDQWGRKISLITYDTESGSGIDLSQLRINFQVKKTTNQSPNLFYARVYNLAPQTMAKVIAFKKVQLLAGYQQGSYGLIFKGTVVNYVRGKENTVDTYLDIFGGDGDRATNNATTIKDFPKGTTDQEKVKEHLRALGEFDVTEAFVPSEMSGQKSLRSHVYAGMSRDGIRELTNKWKADFWIDDGAACIVLRGKYRDGEAVVLSPKTGLIGMPKVTPQGIEAQCLLNSKLRLGGRVKIESSNLSDVPYTPGTAAKTDAQGNVQLPEAAGGLRNAGAAQWGAQLASAYTSPVGLYKILLLEFTGDTRANPWYANMVCIAVGSNGHIIASGIPGEALTRTAAPGLDAPSGTASAAPTASGASGTGQERGF